FLMRCPQVTLDFMVTNRIVDVVGENLDISLRMGGLNDSTLVARKIADLPRIVCASPSYLARHGRPVKPADLAHHSCLTLSRNPGSATWPFRVDGQLVQVDVKGPVSADSTDMLVGLAIEGAGILRLSEHVVGEAIEKGQLEPILQESDHCVGKHFDWSWTSAAGQNLTLRPTPVCLLPPAADISLHWPAGDLVRPRLRAGLTNLNSRERSGASGYGSGRGSAGAPGRSMAYRQRPSTRRSVPRPATPGDKLRRSDASLRQPPSTGSAGQPKCPEPGQVRRDAPRRTMH